LSVDSAAQHRVSRLIAPGKITDFCPLYQQPGSDSAVSQYDKDDVEAIGLVKFDFLGLATLTILELAKDTLGGFGAYATGHFGAVSSGPRKSLKGRLPAHTIGR